MGNHSLRSHEYSCKTFGCAWLSNEFKGVVIKHLAKRNRVIHDYEQIIVGIVLNSKRKSLQRKGASSAQGKQEKENRQASISSQVFATHIHWTTKKGPFAECESKICIRNRWNKNKRIVVKGFRFFFKMNPITSTVAASCNRLVISPRSSPRNSPRNSPVAGRKSPFLDLPEERKRRDSKEILQYKKMLADSTSQAYRAKRIENRNSGVNAGIGNAHTTNQRPPRRLLEEAVQARTAAEKHRKKKPANVKTSSSANNNTKKGKNCSIMWLSWFVITPRRTSWIFTYLPTSWDETHRLRLSTSSPIFSTDHLSAEMAIFKLWLNRVTPQNYRHLSSELTILSLFFNGMRCKSILLMNYDVKRHSTIPVLRITAKIICHALIIFITLMLHQ